MQDFKNINDFRKIRIADQIHEDPTYLTFFFMFDYYTEHSPLLNGEAEEYLRNVVGDTNRADSLANFIKILKKVNSEYPWFWQSVSGLETAKQYRGMMDPFWGEDKAIDISCLETVELTVSGMMDLYKRATFDFTRWVEVIPKNLRRFKLHIWVSEVRTFNKFKTNDNLNNAQGTTTGNESSQSLDSSVVSVKPYFEIALGHCEFDPDSTSDVFSSLNRTPDGPIAPSIKIKWKTVESRGEYANSTISTERSIGQMLGDIESEKTSILSTLGEIARDRLEQTVEGAINRTVENLRARLFLGNVHGINTLSNIQDAIRAGSINAIANLIQGDQPTRLRPTSGLGTAFDPVAPRIATIGGENAYDQTPQDSEGPINQNAYDRTPRDSEGPINQNAYDRTAPDSEGPINQNAYDRTATDSEGPINQNVYDRTPQDSEGPINENVYD